MAAMTGNAIREALEPFAKALEEAAIGTPDTVSLWFHPSAMGLTVGDLRRARVASDAIGAGVKADGAVVEFAQWVIREGCWERGDLEGGDIQDEAVRLGLLDKKPFDPETDDDGTGACEPGDDFFTFSDLLSTHTAAGAGPVGEAVAWREFVLSRIKALGEGDQYGLKSFAIAELQSILDHVARPVEEPGEVERRIVEIIEPKGDENGVWCGSPLEAVIAVQNERDELRSALAESEQNAQGLASDLAGTQAELAETRKRLEKVEAATRALEKAASDVAPYRVKAGSKWSRLTTTILAARAALTGDAQEAGR